MLFPDSEIDGERAPLAANLTDAQVVDLNASHQWVHRLLDARGRVIGNGELPFPSWHDARVAWVRDNLPIAGKRVLEPGCAEGILTLALCHAGADVTAFDARSICVAKAHARTSAFGFFPRILQFAAADIAKLGRFDLIFHSGLLYHLDNPAAHLRQLKEVSQTVALHTITYATADASHEEYRGRWRDETGPHPEREGIVARAFRPTRDELHCIFRDTGWSSQTIWERPEPDGDQWIGFYLLKPLYPSG